MVVNQVHPSYCCSPLSRLISLCFMLFYKEFLLSLMSLYITAHVDRYSSFSLKLCNFLISAMCDELILKCATLVVMQHPSSVCSHHSVPATTLPDQLHVTSDSLLALNNNNLQSN